MNTGFSVQGWVFKSKGRMGLRLEGKFGMQGLRILGLRLMG